MSRLPYTIEAVPSPLQTLRLSRGPNIECFLYRLFQLTKCHYVHMSTETKLTGQIAVVYARRVDVMEFSFCAFNLRKINQLSYPDMLKH